MKKFTNWLLPLALVILLAAMYISASGLEPGPRQFAPLQISMHE